MDGALLGPSRQPRKALLESALAKFRSDTLKTGRLLTDTGNQHGQIVLKFVCADEEGHRIQNVLLDRAHSLEPIRLQSREQRVLSELYIGCVCGLRQTIGIQQHDILIADFNLTLCVNCLRKQAEHWPPYIKPVAFESAGGTAPYEHWR